MRRLSTRSERSDLRERLSLLSISAECSGAKTRDVIRIPRPQLQQPHKSQKQTAQCGKRTIAKWRHPRWHRHPLVSGLRPCGLVAVDRTSRSGPYDPNKGLLGVDISLQSNRMCQMNTPETEFTDASAQKRPK